MRYPAAERLEIIRLVEQSHLPVRRTLAKIGIPPTTFYRWYCRTYAAIFSFCAGVMPPMPMLGRSLL